MKKNEKGLTLVEVLAGIVLLSMILLLVSSIHLFAQKQMNTQKKVIQIQSNERLAFNRITGEIRKANAIKVEDSKTMHIKKTNFTNCTNETDVYKFEGTTLKMKDGEKITDIGESYFKGGTSDNFIKLKSGISDDSDDFIKLKIGNIPETTIYIRKGEEIDGEENCEEI